MDFVFTCVNEDGLAYRTYHDVESALTMLEEFPNDLVIITVGNTSVEHIIKQLNLSSALEEYAAQCDLGNVMYLDRKSTTKRLRALAAGDFE